MAQQPENVQGKLKFVRQFDGHDVEISLREDRLISFPLGVLSFGKDSVLSKCTVFGLTRLPTDQETPIMLLQSVNEPDLGFLVAEPEKLGLEITLEDRETALRETGMEKETTQFLCILAAHPFGEGMALTANLKAPLMIDAERRVGRQHILNNPAYTTQHKL